MATQTTVTMTCDLCGGTKETRTRSISIDGQVLEIDLCAKDGRGLDKVAQQFIPHARKVRRLAAGGRRTASTRQHSASVRDWAKAQGLVVSDRGRIPADVERRYDAAH